MSQPTPPPVEPAAPPSAAPAAVPYGPPPGEADEVKAALGTIDLSGANAASVGKGVAGTAGKWAIRLLLPLIIRAIFRAIFR